MEDKLDELIDIVKLIVEVDRGLSKKDTEWILERLEELQNGSR